MSSKIHPTAIVEDGAQLSEDVVVGPNVLIERDSVVGHRCHIMIGAVICRHTQLGEANLVHPYAVLGGEPQDLKFDPNSQTSLKIGDRNVFREHVTIHRAAQPGGATVIGNDCYFMVGSHVGHDTVVADRVIMVNGSGAGGHVEVGRGATLSAHCMIHQFCWVGEMVMTRGQSGASQHVPPFVMLKNINETAGLNVVGLRRSPEISEQDRREIHRAYRLLYRSGLTPKEALVQMDAQIDWGQPAGRFREFIRRVVTATKPYNRGVVGERSGAD